MNDKQQLLLNIQRTQFWAESEAMDEDRDFSYIDGRTGWRELMAEMYGEALPK